jgi:hypothetical protein
MKLEAPVPSTVAVVWYSPFGYRHPGHPPQKSPDLRSKWAKTMDDDGDGSIPISPSELQDENPLVSIPARVGSNLEQLMCCI